MLRLIPKLEGDGRLSILCLGAHSDDIEIGCGGTILRLLEDYPRTEVHWVVCSAVGPRATEAKKSAELFLTAAGTSNVLTKEFRDGFFPYSGGEIKEFFEELKSAVQPHIIFTHFRHDLHQDHRLVSELTWNTFRNHLILEYEIPKYDGDWGSPTFFVHLTQGLCQKKIDILLECYESQRSKHWFTEDTFRSVLRLRGLESNAPERYAEAFYCRKAVV